MRRLQHQMPSVREAARMRLCRLSPQQNHHGLLLGSYSIKDSTGECLPTQVSM